jgi:peptidoglycan/LPS O-acetylase OafA/YrhL
VIRDEDVATDAAPSDAEPAADERAPAVYRPHLDGLRAVAVYLVVLFHAGSDRFTGGFIGVDVFFVLSGYLVTQILVRDVEATGSVRFGRFYARRFRRLLPAAFVTLIVTGAVFAAIAPPTEVLDSVRAFKAAFLYVSNWFFIRESADYFGAELSANPVLHFWSLGVEEQFYLLWPLLLGGGFAVTRRLGARQRLGLRVAVLAGGLLSVAWAMSIRSTDGNRAYFGTDARAYQLLAGALLALTPGLLVRARRFARPVRLAALGSLGALLLLATDLVELDAIERGVAVTVVTVALIVAIESAEGGWVNAALSTRTMVYLGKVSYGTYLWHWPVIVVATRRFDLSPIAMIAIAALLATALASLSFQILERPVRESLRLDRHRRLVIASGLALSVVSALVIIPAVVDSDRSAVAAPRGSRTGFTRVTDDLDVAETWKERIEFHDCVGKPVERCTLVRGKGEHVLLTGDSHAAMLIPTFVEMAKREDLTFSVDVRGLCPWQRNIYVPATQEVVGGTVDRMGECRELKADLYSRVLPQLEPDVVVLMSANQVNPRRLLRIYDADGGALPDDSPEWGARYEQSTRETVRLLRGKARRVVILEPIPQPADPKTPHPIECLGGATYVEECRFVARPGPAGIEVVYRRIANSEDRVEVLDLDRVVCPFLPICDPVVNGHVVRADVGHLGAPFARTLAVPLARQLGRLGVLA